MYFFLSLSPEGLGVVTGAVYLISMFLFIPIPFLTIWIEKGDYDFPHHEVSFNTRICQFSREELTPLCFEVMPLSGAVTKLH